MPINISKKQNPIFAIPIKDNITYPFVIGKIINKTVSNLITGYREQPVGQLLFKNLDSLTGELNIQYSIYKNITTVAIDVKLLYDGSGVIDQNLLINGTEYIAINSSFDSYGVKKITIDLPTIQNTSKNNLVGLFIYAYNNVNTPENVNTLDTIYFKKVE